MNAEQSEDVLFKLKALADESRLNLIRLLFENERSVGDLAQLIELAEPTVSHHLARLREAGLVSLRMGCRGDAEGASGEGENVRPPHSTSSVIGWASSCEKSWTSPFLLHSVHHSFAF